MVILLLICLTFTASIDKTIVFVGEPFTVSVYIEGEDLEGVGAPRPPSVSGIDILGSSRSQSTQINFINGKISKSTTLRFDYQMIASSEGEYTIPPFTLTYKGEKYSTEPIKINVKKGTPQPQKPQRVTPSQPERKISPSISGYEDVFLDCEVSKGSVYPGEPLIVNHYLYTRVNLTNIQLINSPSYENAWVENLQTPTRLEFSRTSIGGVGYSRALIKRDLIFPLGEKDIQINPASMEVYVRGDFFSFFDERRIISSEPKTIKIKSFPSDRPSEFIDAVGKFSFSAELDTGEVKVDAPFSFKIIIKGEGNINLLSPPEIPSSRKFDVYPPESKVNSSISGGTLKGERVFTYLLTPKVSGLVEIPEIKWAYFDSKTETFIRKTIGPWRIQVKSVGESEKEIVTSKISEDISYVLPVPMKKVYLIPPYLFLYFLPSFIVLLLTSYYVWEKKKIEGDRSYARVKAIPKELKKGFIKLEREKAKGEMRAFYEELSRVLLKFLKLKFNIDVFGMKKEEIAKELRSKDVTEEVVASLLGILEKSEMVRFTSFKPKEDEISRDLKTLKEVINALY